MIKKLLIIVFIAVIGLSMISCIIGADKSGDRSGGIGGAVGGLNLSGDKQMIRNSAREFAEEIDELIENYIETLQSLSNKMSFYEDRPVEARRLEYENLILSVFEETSVFDQMFTVWKPNTIDNMDARFKGRAGSTEMGQFAFALSRVNGKAEKQTADSDIVQAAMAYLTGTGSKTDEISTAKSNLKGWDEWCISIMVPVIKDRTNEPVGVIGCYINTDRIQELAEQKIKYNDEVCGIAVYTNTGFVLASYVPDRIGRQLADVDIQYGNHVNNAANAVKNALEFECLNYDTVLRTNMFMCIAPVPLSGSSSTWSVMIGSPEDYVFRNVKAVKKNAIILLVIIVMVGIIVFVIYIDRKKKGM